MRREQGRKLKELMAKKREQKNKLLETELEDLQQLEQAKIDGSLDLVSFKEELSHRGHGSTEDFNKRISALMLKLDLKQTLDAEPEAQLTNSQALD